MTREKRDDEGGGNTTKYNKKNRGEIWKVLEEGEMGGPVGLFETGQKLGEDTSVAGVTHVAIWKRRRVLEKGVGLRIEG